MKHLSRIRPSGVIAFTALFIAMSGIAVADNDGTAKDNGKVNIGKGKIGFGEISKGAKKKLKGAQGPAGPAGPAGSAGSAGAGGATGTPGSPGTPGGGGGGTASVASVQYSVDGPTDSTVILTGPGFRLRASSDGTRDCNLFIDSTEDNVAFMQFGVDVVADVFRNTVEDDDFDNADADQDLLPDGDDDDLVHTLVVVPLSGPRTTVNLAIDTNDPPMDANQGFDCRINGTATTQTG